MFVRRVLGIVACLFATAPTHVLAGGYQGILERVLAFQAYQIDALNPPGEQRMGVKCTEWDNTLKICTGNWEPCVGSAAGGRCTFKEFVRSLGKAPNQAGDWTVAQPGSTDRIDTERTATLTYNNFKSANTRIRDFPVYRAMRFESENFNKYIETQSDFVDKTGRKYITGATRYLWEDFDNTRRYLVKVRAHDHGKFLIPEARTKLASEKITVELQDLGPDPLDPNGRLQTVDWVQTLANADAAGIVGARKKVKRVLGRFYAHPDRGGEPGARKHRSVAKVYEKSITKSMRCR